MSTRPVPSGFSSRASESLYGFGKNPTEFKRDKDINDPDGKTEHYYNKSGDSLYVRQNQSVDLFAKDGNRLFHRDAPPPSAPLGGAAAAKSAGGG